MSTQTNKTLAPSSSSFDEQVLASETPVLVDFWAPGCGPCQALKSHVEALAADFVGRVRIAFVNVDEHPELAERFEIKSIPALRLFRDGRLVDGHNGMLTSAALSEFMEKAL